MAPVETARHDIGALLEPGRVGAYQRWLVFLTALTIVFDGIDNQLLGVVIPTVMTEWGVTRAAFAPVVSSGIAGMMVGGAVAGMAGDRIGRRTALVASMAVFGAMTLAAATAHDIPTLAVLRFLAGIGLGGAMPNAATLVAEYMPRAQRPMAVTATIVCVPLGAMLAGLLGSQFLPTTSWRTLFIAGGVVPLVAAVVLVRLLPESPRFLARRPGRWPELARLATRLGHPVPPNAAFEDSSERTMTRAPLSALFDREFRRDTLALWVSFCSCLLAVYLGFSWLPTVLAGAGFGASVASNGITAFNLGGVVGALASGAVIAQIGSRPAMLTMAVFAIAGAITLSLMTISPAALTPVMIMLTITGGLINAIQTTMYALATNVYPSAMRATGVGAATAVGRASAILSGYAGPWALALRGSASYFALIAVAMACCLVALASVKRHVGRRAGTGPID
jgi:AAHS family 4-hydroxybenzoate transporter-like MFS transporter